MKKITLLILFIFFNLTTKGQTTLTTGDIAFVGYNADGSDDDFSFVLLKDITANTTITFTDKGWTAAGGFRVDPSADCNSENTIVWTAGSSLTTGTIVTILGFTASVDGVTNGTVVPSPGGCPALSFSISGEALFAYQGSAPTSALAGSQTNFLATINMNGGWDADGTSTTTSAKPAVFKDGTNSIVISPEVDNAVYKGSLAGDANTLRSNINNASNWVVDNFTNYTLPGDIGSSSTSPTVTTIAASAITFSSANLAGNVTADGGATVTERGVVYSLTATNNNPEIGGSGVTKVAIGSGTGVFNQTINSLSNSAGYSFKAYAINSIGTSYGVTQTFTTSSIAPIVTTTVANSISGTSATLGGNVTSDGGDNVIQRGVVYALTANNSNPEVGGADVTVVVIGSGTGSFNQNITDLSLNTAYSFKSYAINSIGTSYGNVDTFTTLANDTNILLTDSSPRNWSDATKWSLGRIPIASDNVVIEGGAGVVLLNVSAEVNQLTINVAASVNVLSNFSLTINDNLTNNGNLFMLSSDTQNSSLILKGTFNGSNINIQRTLTTNWHLISSPLTGATLSSLSSQVTTNGNKFALATYDNNVVSASRWNYYTDNTGANNIATAGNFTSGKGYSIKKLSAPLVFSGQVNTATNLPVAITDGGDNPAGNRWNLIGNPYTSALHGNNAADVTNNFLKVNIDNNNLDPSRAGLYFWTGTAPYEIKSIDDPAFYIAPGQGFFVHAPDGGGTSVSFTEAMQTHQTGDIFLKSSASYPEMILNLTDGSESYFTKVRYIENKTTGLDVGSDVGTFTGEGSSFNVFSHLVSDSKGVDFAIQALPNSGYGNMIVPIGVNAEAGKEITFSIEAINFTSDIKIFLEDKVTNKITRLDEASSNYKITLSENLKGIGRFYLHTSTSTVLNVGESLLENVSIYKSDDSTLRIAGLSSVNTSLKLFTVLGKEVMSSSFKSNGVSDISLPKLVSGVYIVQLQTDFGKLNKKLIIE